MLLPKCPHCQKLLVGVIGDAFIVSTGPVTGLVDHDIAFTWYCPDNKTAEKPDWVEVLEV